MSLIRRGQALPVVPELLGGPPCHDCDALCCQYFALEIDAPKDAEDFEDLRWYLLHGKTWIWVEDDDWFLQVDHPCRYLGPNNVCQIYDERPTICREYGLRENLEHAEDPLCDYFARDGNHDLEFRTPEQIAAYAETFLVEKEREHRRRSAAAKRGWKRRRSAARCGSCG